MGSGMPPEPDALWCPFAQKRAGLRLGDGVGPLHLVLSQEVRLIALIRWDCWITRGFPLVNRTCALPLHLKVGNRGQREQQDGSSWAGRGRCLTRGLIKEHSLLGSIRAGPLRNVMQLNNPVDNARSKRADPSHKGVFISP